MNKFSNVIWGLILIILGVIFGLNALEITNIDVFFDGWWTLFIIVPCFTNLFKEEKKIGNIIGIITGIMLLLACNNLISLRLIFKLIVPITLVFIGFSFIFKDNAEKKIKKEMKKVQVSANNNEHYAIFGTLDLNFAKEKFKGCYLNAIFGGIKCDIRDAKLDSDIVINVCSIFGNIDLIMPEDVNVKITSIPIFGGISDERKNRNNDSKNTIYINATCMFGGVDIK